MCSLQEQLQKVTEAQRSRWQQQAGGGVGGEEGGVVVRENARLGDCNARLTEELWRMKERNKKLEEVSWRERERERERVTCVLVDMQ